MSSLRDLQVQMATDLLGNVSEPACNYILANGLSSQRRLQVYRNNRIANFTAALQACYPVIDRLVGDVFFAHIAKGYIDRTPSGSANLHEYGANFAEYLQSLPAVAGLPYLPDVARLEWACQEVYHAAEGAAFDIRRLALVSPEDYGALQWELNPAVRLLRSPYPVLRIWQLNQSDHSSDVSVNLNEGGVNLMIMRHAGIPEFYLLTAGEYVFLEALAQGQSLLQAQEEAVSEQPDFDLACVLAKHVQLNTFVGCSVVEPISYQKESHYA